MTGRHRLKQMRRKQDCYLGFPIVFREYGHWWRSRHPSTYDRSILR
jgi:hypothetical protein